MPDLHVLACSVLRPELEALAAQGRFVHPVTWYDSRLHMEPARLQATVADFVAAAGAAGAHALLICGECSPGMCELAERPGVARASGCSCVELLVGREERRRLQRDGAFCLLPEWTARWEEIIASTGLGRALSLDALRRVHRRLVYLDTGAVPVPHAALAECAGATGLPLTVQAVALDLLAANLEAAVVRALAGPP
jgi:hypothetical protein